MPPKKAAKPKAEVSEKPQDNLTDLTLEAAVRALESKFGKGAIMLAGVNDTMDVERIPLQHPDLDELTGGGIPRGRVTEIVGWASSGKSTLAIEICAAAQRMGLTVAYIDVEHSVGPDYAEAVGFDFSKALIAQPDSAEEALEMFEALVKTGAIGCIVVDSVAAMATKAELEGEITDFQVGDKARLLGKCMRKTLPSVANTKTAAVFINQYRKNIGGYGKENVTPGGFAIEFAASLRIEISKKETLWKTTAGDKVPVGQVSVVKAIKNKVALPYTKCEVELTFPQGKGSPAGLNRIVPYINRALDTGVLVQKGAWFSKDGQNIAQGRDKLIALLQSDAALLKELQDA